MAIYEKRLMELNKELNDTLRGTDDRQKKAIKATNDIPTGNPPSTPTPAVNSEPTGRELKAQEAASKVTRAQADADNSQQLVKEAKARLDKTPRTNHNALDGAQKWLSRREKDAIKKEAYLEKAKNQAAKALEYAENGHASRREWQANAESMRATVAADDADPSTVVAASPLPVHSKRKAEDNGKDEEQLQRWVAEREALKIHRKECKENVDRLLGKLSLRRKRKGRQTPSWKS